MNPYIFLSLYGLLALADIISTMIALKKGATEAHPIMGKLFKIFGPLPTMVVLKGSVLAATIYAVPLASLDHPWIVWGPLFPSAVHLYSVINNIKVIKDYNDDDD